MREITKIVYETIDSQQFNTKEEAKKHETELFLATFSSKEIAAMLKKMCNKKSTCANCPFYDGVSICVLKTTTPNLWAL